MIMGTPEIVKVFAVAPSVAVVVDAPAPSFPAVPATGPD